MPWAERTSDTNLLGGIHRNDYDRHVFRMQNAQGRRGTWDKVKKKPVTLLPCSPRAVPSSAEQQAKESLDHRGVLILTENRSPALIHAQILVWIYIDFGEKLLLLLFKMSFFRACHCFWIFRLVKFPLLSPVEWEWKQGSLPCTLNFCIYSFGVLGLVILLVFPWTTEIPEAETCQ